MKFKCDFDEFKEAIVSVGKAAKKDKAMEPEMQLVKFTAYKEEETLKIETNGNLIGVEVIIPARVAEEGEFVTTFNGVNIITLRDCLGDLTGASDGKNLILKYKDGKAKSSLPLSDLAFSEVSKPNESSPSVQIPMERLRECFNRVAFIATASEATMTRCIKMEILDDEEGLMRLELSACDNKSFGKVTAFCMKKGSFTGSAVIPPERMKLLIDILRGQDGDSDVSLTFEENKLFSEMGNTRVVFATMENKFPDLNRLMGMRNASTFTATVDRMEFLEAMKCVLYLQPQGSAMLNFSERGLSVGCLGLTEYGETIDAEMNGEVPPVLFSAELLKEISSNIPGDELQIQGTNNKSPFFVAFGDNDEIVYCALPRVNH